MVRKVFYTLFLIFTFIGSALITMFGIWELFQNSLIVGWVAIGLGFPLAGLSVVSIIDIWKN
mgnify:CR=1 FL=1